MSGGRRCGPMKTITEGDVGPKISRRGASQRVVKEEKLCGQVAGGLGARLGGKEAHVHATPGTGIEPWWNFPTVGTDQDDVSRFIISSGG